MRLMYAFTGDEYYLIRIINSLPQKVKIDEIVRFCNKNKDKVVIYGAGENLSLLTILYPEFAFKCIADKDKKKQEEGWKGIPVISTEELIEMKEEVFVVVTPTIIHMKIGKFLLDNGFAAEKIINLGAIIDPLFSAQYFDKDIINPIEDEVLIDGGCYDCWMDENFIKWCDGKYKKIYAFEPDKKNYEKCLNAISLKQIERIELYNKGLWDCETKLYFNETGGGGSAICENEENKTVVIQTVALDDIIDKTEKVSLIKLDIEGAELKALEGAEKIIRRDRPRLAICIYHKPEDIIEILNYILSIHDDYKLYIRHYRLNELETVVYAV